MCMAFCVNPLCSNYKTLHADFTWKISQVISHHLCKSNKYKQINRIELSLFGPSPKELYLFVTNTITWAKENLTCTWLPEAWEVKYHELVCIASHCSPPLRGAMESYYTCRPISMSSSEVQVSYLVNAWWEGMRGMSSTSKYLQVEYSNTLWSVPSSVDLTVSQHPGAVSIRS